MAGGDEVPLHLGLAVHPHVAADQIDEVQVVAIAGVADRCRDARYRSAPTDHPARRAQQLHRRVFEDACPDACQHVILGAGFDDHGVEAVGGEQVRQQHACRPAR